MRPFVHEPINTRSSLMSVILVPAALKRSRSPKSSLRTRLFASRLLQVSIHGMTQLRLTILVLVLRIGHVLILLSESFISRARLDPGCARILPKLQSLNLRTKGQRNRDCTKRRIAD